MAILSSSNCTTDSNGSRHTALADHSFLQSTQRKIDNLLVTILRIHSCFDPGWTALLLVFSSLSLPVPRIRLIRDLQLHLKS